MNLRERELENVKAIQKVTFFGFLMTGIALSCAFLYLYFTLFVNDIPTYDVKVVFTRYSYIIAGKVSFFIFIVTMCFMAITMIVNWFFPWIYAIAFRLYDTLCFSSENEKKALDLIDNHKAKWLNVIYFIGILIAFFTIVQVMDSNRLDFSSIWKLVLWYVITAIYYNHVDFNYFTKHNEIFTYEFIDKYLRRKILGFFYVLLWAIFLIQAITGISQFINPIILWMYDYTIIDFNNLKTDLAIHFDSTLYSIYLDRIDNNLFGTISYMANATDDIAVAVKTVTKDLYYIIMAPALFSVIWPYARFKWGVLKTIVWALGIFLNLVLSNWIVKGLRFEETFGGYGLSYLVVFTVLMLVISLFIKELEDQYNIKFENAFNSKNTSAIVKAMAKRINLIPEKPEPIIGTPEHKTVVNMCTLHHNLYSGTCQVCNIDVCNDCISISNGDSKLCKSCYNSLLESDPKSISKWMKT